MIHPTVPQAGGRDVEAAVATLATRLPAPLRPLAAIAYNLRWSWDRDGDALFSTIDADRWAVARHDAVRLLVESGPDVLARAAADDHVLARVSALECRIADDLARPKADGGVPDPVVFLCAEYGVHRSLPLYAGGLGILAGDILKEASDQALPMIAIGLRYHLGYFHQRLDLTGWQHEYWTEHDPGVSSMVRLTDGNGAPLEVPVAVYDRTVRVQALRVDVGRVPLLLLDTNLPANDPVDRWITARLYEGSPELRLAQYVVLGVGSMRLLDALGIEPGLLHLNEGHPACAPLELMARRVAAGATTDEAASAVRERCVFTTHTPVPAGNETYPSGRFLAALGDLPDRVGLGADGVLALARTRSNDQGEEPGMTPIALRLARDTNGVSRRHGDVARGMWHGLHPGPRDGVPIGSITNGVHVPTWLAAPIRAVLDRHLGDGWWDRAADPTTWEAVDGISDEELWAARTASRVHLIDWVKARSVDDRIRRGMKLEPASALSRTLDPHVLTVGFARRVASYKRLYLLGFAHDRIASLLGGSTPVQVLVSGKAHPRDDHAKGLVRDLFGLSVLPEVARRVAYLEDYDMEIGAMLTSGCDVWLNVPRPPLEASGTSGMKSVLNGGLNVSVLDGWWAEAYDGSNGWGIDGAVDDDHGRQDHAHAQAVYDLFEHEVVPLFHDRGDDGVPHGWVARMRSSLRTLGWRFSATRMVREYADGPYRG